MAKKYNASMFDKIKDALKKTEKTSGGSFSNLMRFPAGHTYTIRLIPNVENVDDTFFHHWLNQWSSKKDGSFVSAISLKTFEERDPINEARWKLYKEWKATEPSKDDKFENPIKEKEAWLVNAYWVDNPSNPELNGKVQILNMGPQLKKIVDTAMIGEDADEFGAAIFDLSKDGCDFKIKAEEQGIYTTYISSRFSSKSKLDLSDEEIEAIYENVHDLKQIYAVKTVDELQALLDDHFYCGESEVVNKTEKKPLQKKEVSKPKTPVVEDEDVNDDIPMFHKSDKTNDPDVDDLLASLDID
jgi:hypothetical protein